MNFIHNNISSKEIRMLNEEYNNTYISKLTIPQNFYFSDSSFFSSNNLDDNINCTVWLQNIDRLFNLILPKIQLSDYIFYDIGCGDGIALSYVISNFSFKSYFGLDFNSCLISKCNELLNLNSLAERTKLQQADASIFILNDFPSICFLFNPFGIKTFNNFLSNNISNLKNNNSIILYANDLHINQITGYKNIVRDDFFNLSVIYF